MKLLRRLIAWSFFAGLLTALGVVVFHWVRYQPRFVVAGPNELVYLSDDGRWLVTGDTDHVPVQRGQCPGQLHVFDTHEKTLIRSFDVVRYPSGVGPIWPVAQSPDRRYFACCRKTDCLLIDWQSGQQWTIPTGKGEVMRDCEFSEHGRWLKITIWDADDEYTVLGDVATGNVARRFLGRVAGFMQNDRIAVCCVDANRVDLVDVATGERITSLQSSIDLQDATAGIAATDDGRWLALWNGVETIEIWDVPNRRRRFQFEDCDDVIITVAFNRRGTHFAAAQMRDDGDYKVEVFDFEKRDAVLQAAWSLKQTQNPGGDSPTFGMQHDFFSTDDRLLLAPTNDGHRSKLAVLDIAAGAIMWEKTGYDGEWLPGAADQLLCTHDTDAGVYLLDAKSGATRSTFGEGCTSVYYAQATSDGRFVLVRGTRDPSRHAVFWKSWLDKLGARRLTNSDALLVVGETSTGSERFRLPQPEPVHACLSEDGETLATWTSVPYLAQSSESNRGVQLWNTSPRHAYLWAATVSCAAGLVLLLLRRWRRNRKAAALKSAVAKE